MKKTKVYRPRRGMRFSNGRKGVSPPAGFVGGDAISRTRPNSSEEADSFTVKIAGEVESSLTSVNAQRIWGTDRTDGQFATFDTRDDILIPNGPVLRYFVVGDAGNDYTMSFASGTVEAEGTIVDGPGSVTTFTYVSGTTTINDFQNKVTSGSTFIRVQTTSSTPSAKMGNVQLDGGSILGFGGVTARDSFFVTSSLVIEGAVSTGRGYERRKLDQTLLDRGPIVNFQPFPSKRTMDVNLTSSFEPPSWTRSYMGESQAFVIPVFTGSNVENIAFNTYVSSRETLESSDVPATRAIHSVKQQKLQTLTVKKTASFFDTVANQFNSSSQFFPPKRFVASSGSLVSEMGSVPVSVSGSTALLPCVITIDVPTQGKLVDIKVWVELQHESSSTNFKYTPLGCLCLALRSPNVSWNGFGSPIENDPEISQTTAFDVGFQTHQEIWRNSFVLWEGAGIFSSMNPDPTLNFGDGLSVTPAVFSNFNFATGSSNNGNPKWFSKFTSWDRDLSMRTVFSDGATTNNPRMNYSSNLSGNFIGAPNSNAGINSPWGLGVNWTGSSGSPPAGWLTGPGGAAAVNEWPTTGVNNGTPTIRPMYPLLDPIFQGIPAIPGVTMPAALNDGVPINYSTLAGFRPGLRGSEISGTWKLLIAAGSSNQDDLFKLWFKQLRLEITYETGIGGSRFRSGFNARRPGDSFLYSVSGTAGPGSLTATLNTFTTVPEQNSISRTFGVLGNSGSVNTSAALLYRLTGSLGNISGPTPNWLFRGPFGMPIIPESSASLVPIVRQSIESTPFSDFIQPRRELDLPQRLADVASDANAQVRLRDLAAAFVSSSAT